MQTINLNPSSLANANKNTIANPLTWFTNLEDPQPQGIIDYINPTLKQIETTIIPEHCTLWAISTFENPESYSGHHTWVFQIDNPDEIEDNDPLREYLTNTLKQIFSFDPEASMIAPNVFYDGNYFTITVPYTC